ncbi:MKK3 [Symbiodinium pilosum]|uniref:mitogen-activated protein kinase kinase n=1 Tax=Symbiodinium pilosum TaxID=2952 RepID=A0A812WEM9_SYMPI|nr:MKK3 [Symbiodinium pilosum]
MDFGGGLQLQLDSDGQDANQLESWAVQQDGSLRHGPTNIVIGEGGLRDGVGEIEVDQTNLLGRGAGGVVCRAVHTPTGMPLAVKVVRVEDKAKRDQLINEIHTLFRITKSHFLIELYDAYVHKESGCVHVALEYMDYGSLADVKRRVTEVPENLLALILMQILEGLKILHLNNVVHRDVKLGNILVNSRGSVKVTDFGISKNLGDSFTVCDTFVGTATHMSPERVNGKDYSFAADIWSLGLCVYELASGVYPYGSVASFPALFDNLINRPEPRLKEGRFSRELCRFVEVQLCKEPEERWSAIELQASDFILFNLPKVSEAALIRWLDRHRFQPLKKMSRFICLAACASTGPQHKHSNDFSARLAAIMASEDDTRC